jgi:hypothetical protein
LISSAPIHYLPLFIFQVLHLIFEVPLLPDAVVFLHHELVDLALCLLGQCELPVTRVHVLMQLLTLLLYDNLCLEQLLVIVQQGAAKGCALQFHCI